MIKIKFKLPRFDNIMCFDDYFPEIKKYVVVEHHERYFYRIYVVVDIDNEINTSNIFQKIVLLKEGEYWVNRGESLKFETVYTSEGDIYHNSKKFTVSDTEQIWDMDQLRLDADIERKEVVKYLFLDQEFDTLKAAKETKASHRLRHIFKSEIVTDMIKNKDIVLEVLRDIE